MDNTKLTIYSVDWTTFINAKAEKRIQNVLLQNSDDGKLHVQSFTLGTFLHAPVLTDNTNYKKLTVLCVSGTESVTGMSKLKLYQFLAS